MDTKVKVESLFKIFGRSPLESLKLYQSGTSREEVMKKTGDVIAVAGVSFSVDEGEVFVVMGLSGSGKSTLIRCINRLLPATSGRVYIDDEDIQSVDQKRLRDIRLKKLAMVFQNFALFPHRTVAENAEYGIKLQGVEKQNRRERALEILEMVGLLDWADRPIGALSGGMQQRVGLARAMAKNPDILLMDEAFSALDPLSRRQMQDELISLQCRIHKTIIFITHDLNEALKLGDRIAVMRDGQLVQTGSPEEIVSNPANDYVSSFTRDINRGLVFTAGSLMQPAEFLFAKRDTVQTAMHRMRNLEQEAIYVVDTKVKPIGIVTDQDIVTAVQQGIRELSKVMRTDFPQTGEFTPLAGTLTLCSSGLPIAVVSESGELRGVLDPLECLNNMTPEESTVIHGEAEEKETVKESSTKVP